VKAIPTTYRGVRFRSRLEAQYATFFDAIGTVWQYEPEGYISGSTKYLPDFWLPDVASRGKPGGVYFEVKPGSPLEGEIHKARMVSWGAKKPVVIAVASPMAGRHESMHEYVGGDNPWEDDGLSFGRCDDCRRVSIDFYASFRSKPCTCALGEFDPIDARLEEARQGFGNYSRWERAA